MNIPWLAPAYKWLDSGSSPGVQQAFLAGFQAKQNALDRELRVRELDMRTQQQDILNDLRTEKMHADLIAQEGVAALATAMGEASRQGYDQESEAKFWDTAAKYPGLGLRPEFREFTQQFELSRNAKLRRELLQSTITGRSELEQMKFENRETLLGEKYDRLATLQEDSQEARTLRDEIQHLYRLEEQEKKPRSTSGVNRFDLPWTDQATMKAELDAITRDPFAFKAEERAKRIEAVYRKYKAIAAERQQSATPAPTNAPMKVLKFDPATGTFK